MLELHIVVWTDDGGDLNAQAYTDDASARADYGAMLDGGEAKLVTSTVQGVLVASLTFVCDDCGAEVDLRHAEAL